MTLMTRKRRTAVRRMNDLARRRGDGGVALLPGVSQSGMHWLARDCGLGVSLTPTAGTLGPDSVTRPSAAWLAAYVESTASTPAAVDGPVGFLSDGAGTVGANVVTNGMFASGATGWSATGGTSVSVGSATLPTSGNLKQYGTTTTGVAYMFQITVSAVSAAGNIGMYSYEGANGVVLYISTPGVYTGNFVAYAGGGIQLAAFTFAGTITSIRLLPLTGRHATQGTGANKPTMRKGFVNQTYYSQQIGNGAGWSTWNAGSITTTTAPDGSSTATQFTVTSGPGGRFQAGHAVTAGVPVTSMMIAKPVSGGSQLQLTVAANSAFGGAGGDRVLVIDGATGALVNKSAEVTGYSVEPMAGGYWLIVGNCTPTSTSSTDAIAAYGVATGQVLAAWMAGRTTGTLTAKQILAAGGIPLTTTIAASSSGGNYALEFGGSVTQLQSSFAPTNAATVVLAVRVNSFAGTPVLVGQAAGGLQVHITPAGSVRAGVNGGTIMFSADGIVTAGAVYVISVRIAINGTSTIRVNGVVVATSTAFAAVMNQTTISIGSNAGAGNFTAGLFGPVLLYTSVLSDAETLVLERGAGALAPITGVKF